MTSSDWATVIYSYTFTATTIGGGVWYVAKKAIKHVIDEQSKDLKEAIAPVQELKPNGGSSINDKINLQVIPMLQNLTERQTEIGDKVSRLEGAFDQHIKEHE